VRPIAWLLMAALAAAVVGLLLLPLLVATVILGDIQQVSQVSTGWDIPPAVVPALQEAAAQAGISWFLLAGVASVATDFARHAPDGVDRGDTAGTAIFPVVTPPIGRVAQGQGMFLVDPRAGEPVLADAQDVRESAVWLASVLATLSQGSPLAAGDLSNAAVSQFWQHILVSAPIDIATPAPNGADQLPGSPVVPVTPGSNPIQQFGGAVLVRIAAPVTTGNLGAFSAWAAGEGTCAHFNPLATTQPEPGATPFNTLSGGGHVWNYPSFDVGVDATTTALTNGLYKQVIAAFQADAGVDAVAAAVERSPWGTHHFGSTSYAGLPCSNDGAGSSAPPSTVPPVTETGPDAVPTTIVARAAQYQQIWDETET